jgi:glycerol-1-phosphate dehydrogenase [NAD(P)+]
MNSDQIGAALREASDTRVVAVGAGELASAARVFAQAFGERPAAVVADENTMRVAGGAAHGRLQAEGPAPAAPLVFPAEPALYAEERRVDELAAALCAHDAVPVAVGSGTINDITKLAAHRCGRPYMVVATAASMDGYTAFGAAITSGGFKQTFACPAPLAVLADTEILAQAPPAMTASGYADLLGKLTAGADWLVADALGAEPLDARSWSLVQESLRAWTASPHLLRSGDEAAVGRLFTGLLMTGLAMQAHRSSRPASGSEHQFSHLWEMHEATHGAVSHGFKVGLGSLASAALYERVLRRDLAALDVAALARAWPSRAELERAVRQSHPNPAIQEKAVEQSLAKHPTPAGLSERLHLLRERWPALRERLEAQLLPAARLRELLAEAGCPTRPAEIGKSATQLWESYAPARQIRSRYTVFDLAAEAGCFDACVGELFAPGGFWAED